MKKRNFLFLLIGIIFGITLIKADAVSWFRMQEMFHFQGFQMYGIFLTAIPTGALSVWLIKKLNIKTIDGEPVVIVKKKFNLWDYFRLHDFWNWLGVDRNLPRAYLCTNRKWFNYCNSHLVKRSCRNMGLRLFKN